jgi:hypothetical protein
MESIDTVEAVVNIKRNDMLKNMDNLEYMRFMKSKGYKMERLHIDETSEIVTVYDLGKDCYGKVINIRCPARYRIFILGRNQLPKDHPSDNICAHTLSLILSDIDGNEIFPDSRIRITKEKPSFAMTTCATMLYKDITKTEYSKIPPNRIKSYDKLYKFDNGIQMNGEDRLSIEVIQPNLDISSSGTRLDLDIDLWEEI